MPTKDFNNWGFGLWILTLLMSLTGGFLKWYTHFKQSYPRQFNLFECIGRSLTNALVGFNIFVALQFYFGSADLSALVGYTGGHLSVELLMLNNDIERAIKALDQFYLNARKLDTRRYAVLINMTFNMGS